MNYDLCNRTVSVSQTNTSVKGRYGVKDNLRKSNSTSPENCSGWPPSRRVAVVVQGYRAVVFLFELVLLIANALGSGTVPNCDQASLLAALSGGGKVAFACDGTIVLTNTITIATNTVLDASGHTVTISGNNAVRVFTVTNGAAFALVNVTIANGRSQRGSGILNFDGFLTLLNCTLSNNTAIAVVNYAAGGGILNGNVLAATNCLFAGNMAMGPIAYGGAIETGRPMTLVNCTFFGNMAVADESDVCCGVGAGGAIDSSGGFSAINCTFAGNSARGLANGEGVGGALSVNGGCTLRNCILANNPSAPSPQAGNAIGLIIDGGNNISSDGTCKFTAPSSLNNTDPRLAPLADNGGPTKTMALLEDSPAVDTGSLTDCPATDQRGVPRPVGARCDIGAFEGSISLPRFSQTLSPTAILEGTTSRLTFVLSNAAAVAYTGVAFTNDLPPQIIVANNSAVSNICGSGTISAPPDGNRIVASGITLGPRQTCSISISVTASAHGSWTNPAVVLWSNETGAGRTSNPSALAVAGRPVVKTEFFSNLTRDSVVLHATVNPSGFDSTVFFEYGITTNLGNRSATRILGPGFQAESVMIEVTGLSPNTTYFYRAGATNAQGISLGEMRNFPETITNCTEASLRAALDAGGFIKFACDGVIVLSNTITIGRDTVLDGTSRALTISGNNSVRLFNVTTGTTFTVMNLTLANGRHQGAAGMSVSNGQPAFGGAIYNAGGTVNIVNCMLTNHSALGGGALPSYGQGGRRAGTGSGGAIYNQGGRLGITNSTFAGNLAQGGYLFDNGPYGADSFGGAIWSSDGLVSLVNVLFAANRVIGGGTNFGFMYGGVSGNAFGGAVFARGGSVVASNVSFHANNAQVPRMDASGAGAARGGALYISNGVVHLLRGIFATNAASGGPVGGQGRGGVAQGGAIYNQGQLLLRETLFAGNRADGGYGGGSSYPISQGGGDSQGGALYTATSAVVDARFCR